MVSSKQSKSIERRRGLLTRPLDALVFLAPMLMLYEYISLTRPSRVIAFDWMKGFFELFGYAGMWAPSLAILAILLSTHAASRERWTIAWRRVGLMYPEAVVLAIPLLVLNWAIPLAGAAGSVAMLDRTAVGIGAGIYEELIFRLILISLIVMIGTDLLRLDRVWVAAVAIALSSLAFAAHHHRPFGHEPFCWLPFFFRTVAGCYLAIIFWYRGYVPAAGCHAAYNVALPWLGQDGL